jgi:DNA invertase Pin-like site-specific DNA recombinase
MTDALGYTRLSQTSDTSIANQKENIRAYAEANDFDLLDILDDGERSSGFSPDDLEAYEILVERIRQSDIDAVIVNAKRRLVRDENEVMRLVADLRSNGVELHTHQSGQVDLSEPINAAIEILRASAAAEEKRKEIERAKEAIQKKQNRGDDLGRPRFGMTYSDDKRRQVPGEDFETVREILELRQSGATYEEISERTGVPVGTAHSVVNRREWYAERGELSPKSA